MFSWFDAAKAKQFGVDLADYIIAEHGRRASKNPRKAESAAARLRETLTSRIERFRAETPLNIYKTAQLANAMKWKLSETDMAASVVDEITRFVLLQLRSAPASRKPG